MKINGITNNYSINSYKNYSKPSIGNTRSSTDTVEISTEAFNLLNGNIEIRNDKISNVLNKIADGCYYINTTDVVDKMIKNLI